MKVEIYGYGETCDAGKTGRIDVRFVGRANISEFIGAILGGDTRGTKWIRDRMCKTSNEYDIELANKHKGKVVAYNQRTKEILKIISIKD